MTPSPHWPAVGEAITARIKAAGLSQAEVARRSGVSDATVRKLEKGTPGNYRPDRLAKVSVALDWPPDMIERLLAGESVSQPAVGTEALLQARFDQLDARLQQMSDDIDAAATKVVAALRLVAARQSRLAQQAADA